MKDKELRHALSRQNLIVCPDNSMYTTIKGLDRTMVSGPTIGKLRCQLDALTENLDQLTTALRKMDFIIIQDDKIERGFSKGKYAYDEAIALRNRLNALEIYLKVDFKSCREYVKATKRTDCSV